MRILRKQLVWILVFLGSALSPAFAEDVEVHRKALLEALEKPEYLQLHSYTDFGPEVLTVTQLKKSGFFGKKPGDVKVIVFAGSYEEVQYLTLLDAGKLDKDTDYRFLWYPTAMYLLDEVLKHPKLLAAERKKVEATRANLLKKMGTHEEAMARNKSLKKAMRAVSMDIGKVRQDAVRKRFTDSKR
ncbi:hypothetical protein NT6N_25760 [Oceaniferula spumae]|uniref:Uncharacterized protein n=1 Tax=Oceaniferula spumae TaxID=2979115 RepID=A0AAT9FNG9_9BACT